MDFFNPGSWFSSWASSMGGSIASGLESGFLAIIKDLWDVILGPVEIILGALLILFAIIFIFSSDITRVAGIAGAMA